jgi:ribonuclease Z
MIAPARKEDAMGRGIWIGVGVLVALAAAGALLLRVDAVEDRLVERAVESAAASSPADALFQGDALRVLLCGTSSPLPHRERAKACVAVIAGGKFWVVDVGPGSWNRLALRRVPGERIGGVLLTHFHSDHIGELGEFNMQTWVAGRSAPLAVYGPPGVEHVVAGFAEAYALDNTYRIRHHGAALLPADRGRMEAKPFALDGAADAAPVVVLRENGLEVRAFRVDHSPIDPAVGYRFDYNGRSVVVSGDTVKDARLIAAAKSADVLVHEAQANHMVEAARHAMERHGRTRIAKLLGDIQTYHTTPVDAALAANEAGARLLVLYHLTPPPAGALAERVFVRGVDDVRPEGVVLAEDGTLVELPARSTEVHVSRLE